MHDGGACKVEKAHLVKKTAAPFPGRLYGIDDGDQDDREDQKRPKFDPLRQDAGNDGRRRCAEHQLKEEIRPNRGVGNVADGVCGDANGFKNRRRKGAKISGD